MKRLFKYILLLLLTLQGVLALGRGVPLSLSTASHIELPSVVSTPSEAPCRDSVFIDSAQHDFHDGDEDDDMSCEECQLPLLTQMRSAEIRAQFLTVFALHNARPEGVRSSLLRPPR